MAFGNPTANRMSRSAIAADQAAYVRLPAVFLSSRRRFEFFIDQYRFHFSTHLARKESPSFSQVAYLGGVPALTDVKRRTA